MFPAGKNVRQMAAQRRSEASFRFVLSIVAVFFPLLLPFIGVPITAVAGIWVGCLIFSGINFSQAQYLLKRAKHADQGAAGEEAIATILKPLETRGWTIEYGILIRSVGDVDVFLLSPQGRAFIIDVKSHWGEVRSDGRKLYRWRKHSTQPFEKDFLTQAKRQAVEMAKLKNLRFVTPMIAFSNARVKVGSNPVAGVYVVSKSTLMPCLRSQG
jgi:hypothetical protein